LLEDNHSICKVTVDGTDFRIQEPMPFSEGWFSHKFHGPAVRYEVCVNIQNGWIVLVNGPFPAGEWPDLRIAREKLCPLIADSEFPDELALADGGYFDDYEFFDTPTGENNEEQKMKADARARHKTINRRFKQWGILQQIYRGSLHRHGHIFQAIANITQLMFEHYGIRNTEEDGPEELFNVEYYDRCFEDDDSDENDEEEEEANE
jgi:hypothetical protein